MKISVIIPVFNTEKYLERCLDSVVNQTYSNLEIILVNDGSTDNSLSILRKYEKADRRIIIIDQTNAGLSKARNVALDIMTGDYLSFVDSDDYIDTNTFENVMGMIASSTEDVDMIAFPTDSVYEDGTIEPYHFLPTGSFIEKYDLKLLKKIRLEVEIWSKVFKSSIFQSVRFPEGRIYEDVWVFPDIDKQLKVIGYSAIGKYYYSTREGSIMSMSTLANLKLRLEAERRFFDYLYCASPSISKETAKIEFYFVRGMYLIEDKHYKRGWKYYYYFFKFMIKRKASRFNFMGMLMFFWTYISYILIKISGILGLYNLLKRLSRKS